MSLSRVKVWSLGDVLSASDLNAEFNNILNNAASLISPALGNFDLDGYTLIDAVYKHTPVTFAANDATPAVSGGTVFKTANAAPTTITMFDSGVDGQTIWVLVNDTNTTIDFTGTNLKGNAGADWSPTTGDTIQAVFISPNWYCRISDNTA